MNWRFPDKTMYTSPVQLRSASVNRHSNTFLSFSSSHLITSNGNYWSTFALKNTWCLIKETLVNFDINAFYIKVAWLLSLQCQSGVKVAWCILAKIALPQTYCIEPKVILVASLQLIINLQSYWGLSLNECWVFENDFKDYFWNWSLEKCEETFLLCHGKWNVKIPDISWYCKKLKVGKYRN